MTPVEVQRGDSPIVLGLPHTGTHVPEDVHAALNDRGRAIADTDWHIHTLYDGLLPGVTTVRATFHRYAIDANRDPSGASLYPGQNTTGLVPLTDFDGHSIWQTEPTAEEIEARRTTYHAPYHAALQAELDRVHDKHGVVILYDCHSIRSLIPFLFDGTLPDLNIGSNHQKSCAPAVEEAVVARSTAATEYSSVLNGRFTGGWTTRHYGRPDENRHAIQMELAQTAYLTEENAPWDYDPQKAAQLRPVLSDILHALEDLAPTLGALK